MDILASIGNISNWPLHLKLHALKFGDEFLVFMPTGNFVIDGVEVQIEPRKIVKVKSILNIFQSTKPRNPNGYKLNNNIGDYPVSITSGELKELKQKYEDLQKSGDSADYLKGVEMAAVYKLYYSNPIYLPMLESLPITVIGDITDIEPEYLEYIRLSCCFYSTRSGGHGFYQTNMCRILYAGVLEYLKSKDITHTLTLNSSEYNMFLCNTLRVCPDLMVALRSVPSDLEEYLKFEFDMTENGWSDRMFLSYQMAKDYVHLIIKAAANLLEYVDAQQYFNTKKQKTDAKDYKIESDVISYVMNEMIQNVNNIIEDCYQYPKKPISSLINDLEKLKESAFLQDKNIEKITKSLLKKKANG